MREHGRREVYIYRTSRETIKKHTDTEARYTPI